MRWQGQRESENVEDRRGQRPAQMAIGGGLGAIVIILIALFLGVNPQNLLNLAPRAPVGPQAGPALPPNPAQEELKRFVSVVLASTEDVWNEQLRQLGSTYRAPKLVMFTGEVRSACGSTSSAVGPFYCPADQTIYIDLDFYAELKDRFKAPGDFAQAYVIAHEVGHHVQNLLGISDKVHAQRNRLSEEQNNELSVRLELQADFYAGVWAHHAQRKLAWLEQGDIEEGLRAAKAIGDDNIQKQTQGYVVPDSFTHGSSEQRTRWFRAGMQTGDIEQGDTFRARNL